MSNSFPSAQDPAVTYRWIRLVGLDHRDPNPWSCDLVLYRNYNTLPLFLDLVVLVLALWCCWRRYSDDAARREPNAQLALLSTIGSFPDSSLELGIGVHVRVGEDGRRRWEMRECEWNRRGNSERGR